MANVINKIREELFRRQDVQYRDFQVKLIPTVRPESVIGVRTPELRNLAKQLVRAGKDAYAGFLLELPHAYFDENQLHAFLIAEQKDYEACLAEVERFLLYVDNWATCDQLSPKVFKKHHQELLTPIRKWIASGDVYTIRFGVGMLMEHFLDADFKQVFLDQVAAIRSEEYYVRMMVAWYFATALAKQYDSALPYLEQGRLDGWTHQKTIQKAVESNRITPDQKAYLKTLRREKTAKA